MNTGLTPAVEDDAGDRRSAATITTYPVSQRVNSVRGKNAGDPSDPTLIEPVTIA